MIIYEVSLCIPRHRQTEFTGWLATHVQEILRLEGFVAAQIVEPVTDAESRSDEGHLPPRANEMSLVVLYWLRGQADLDHYVREHAPRMRADGVGRFGSELRSRRRVLTVTHEFTSALLGDKTRS